MEWNKKNPRFVKTYIIDGFQIFVDKETGVHYMFYMGGLTPLLDKDGKPVIDKPTV